MAGVEDDIQQWLRYAESDTVSSEALHKITQELNAIFHLQQAVEKTLKAVHIKQNSTMPPRLHDLQKLAGGCGLHLTKERERLLMDLTTSYIDSRYPEQWGASPLGVSGEKTAKLIAETKDFIAWLKQKL